MLKFLGAIILEAILFLLFLIFLPSSLIREKVGLFDETGNRIFPLDLTHQYAQTLSNPKHSLNSLSLQLKNPLILNNDRINVDIRTQTGEILNDFVIYGSNVGDPSWIKFKFNPIVESPLQVNISSTNNTPDSLYIIGSDMDRLNIKTTYQTPAFFTRLQEEIQFQLNLFANRSSIHNYFYIATLLLLSLILVF